MKFLVGDQGDFALGIILSNCDVEEILINLY